VLWEEEQEIDGQRYWHGHSDNYIEVYGHGRDLRNRVTPVRLGEPFKGGLLAQEEVR
jgi:hypothetical protein